MNGPPSEVDRSFGEHARDAVRPGEERAGTPSNSSAARRSVAEEIHRDPHDLALLLAEADEVVDPGRFVEGEADRHFIDDVRVEDVLDLIEGP